MGEFNLFKDIKSEIRPFHYHNEEELLQEVKKYQYAVVYRADRVDVLKAADISYLARFMELRAFDTNEELHVIQVRPGVFKGRYRTDTPVKGKNTVWEETHLLWGNPVKAPNGGINLSEYRGTKIKLRFDLDGFHDRQSNQRVFIQIRNYLNQDQERFYFEDFRFVDFFLKEVKPYE